jgi:hypothetical protein
MIPDKEQALRVALVNTILAKAYQRKCRMVTSGELPYVPEYCERAAMTEDERGASDGCPQCEEGE